MVREDGLEALAAYVPRVVREWLDSDTPDALHRVLDGSMVFVDISGFTKLSERMARLGKAGSEGVTDVIATCFERLLDDAYAYDGSLLKFGGDALLLFFRGDAHPRRAAASALAMRRTLREVSKFDTEAGRVQLGMTVGVHSGAFDFFLVGGSHRELVITGPVSTELVDTEGCASTGEIVVSATTAAALPAANLGPAREHGRLLRGTIDTPRLPPESGATDRDLSRFVPSALADAVRHRQSLESEHRNVTIAFVQFAGLDGRIAAGETAVVAAELEQLVQIVQAAVDERRISFLSTDVSGDGGKIILAAGAPSITGHDEEQMLLAVRAIVDAEPAIAVRIGVNAGPVFAGEIGTEFRRNYTVMGDPVNLAARVMAKALPGQILATDDVLDRSHTLFETTPLPPFLVKGKRLPVTAHVVGSARGVRQQLATGELPLVGRERELEAWRAVVDNARSGRGHTVEIVAEPGAGKSRLLQHFLEGADDFAVHRVGCRLYQVDTPYLPVALLLESVLDLAGGDADDRALRLRELLERRFPDLSPWAALIGIPLRLEIEPSESVRQLDPSFRKARIEAVVVELLTRILTRPTLLCIEDAHWIDDASADLLAGLAAHAETRPWALVITRRTRGTPELPDRAVTRLALAPLDQRATVELIDAATAGAPMPRHVVRAMAERCDGNPLFLLELLNAVRSGGSVEALPSSVEALINARIDRLPTVDRDVLRRASVLGAGFYAEHLAAVLPERDPRRMLQRLRDFVAIDERGWVSFRHALARDVAYEGLPFRTRRALHGQVADSIGGVDEIPREQAALLSLHLLHARRDREAWRCARSAADDARAVYANLDAAALYARALVAARRLGDTDDVELGTTYEALGDVQDLAGLYDEARLSYRAARRALHAHAVQQAGVHLKEAYVAERRGKYSESIRCVRRGLALLGPDDDPGVRARLTTWEAAVRTTQGRFREALVAADLAATLSAAAGDEGNLARTYLILDFAEINLGVSTGGPHPNGPAATALEIYTRIGDLSGEANAANNVGVRHYYEGRWDEAAELYRQARRARDRMGDPVNSAFCAVNLAELLVEQGRLGPAEEALREALTVLIPADDRWGVAFARQVLGIARVRGGDVAGGAELIRSAQADYVAIGARSSAIDASTAIAEHLVLDGRPAEALSALEEILHEHRAHGGHEPQMPIVHRLRGYALAQLGDHVAAIGELQLAVDLARQLGAEHEVGLALDARLNVFAAAREAGHEFADSDADADADERDAILSRLGIQRRANPLAAAGAGARATSM